MASLLTRSSSGQRPAGGPRGPAGAARRLAQAQDGDLHGAASRGGCRPPGHRPDRRRGDRRGLEARGRLHLGRAVGPRGARARRRGREARRFAVLAGDVVPAKKPDPAIYVLALERIGVGPPDAIVVEDSRNGLLAAVGAGLRCVVTVSGYTRDEDFSEAVLVVTSLGDPGEPATVIANRSAAEPGGRSARRPAGNPADPTRRSYERRGAAPRPSSRPGDRADRGRERAVLLRPRRRRGDGDFGYSLARGFEMVLADFDELDYETSAGCSRGPRSC